MACLRWPAIRQTPCAERRASPFQRRLRLLRHTKTVRSPLKIVAAFCDFSFPTFNYGAFELTLLLLGRRGRRKCQKCRDDLAEHRHLPRQKYNKWLLSRRPNQTSTDQGGGKRRGVTAAGRARAQAAAPSAAIQQTSLEPKVRSLT
jgi:hypothetical protein